MGNRARSYLVVLLITWLSLHAEAQLPVSSRPYLKTEAIGSVHATQAAAADEKIVYAVSSTDVAKLDRATGQEMAVSKGPAQHLNSGFLWQGKLYCAHSNYPRQPHQSDVRVLDPGTMELTISHACADPPGSLTWVVRRGEHWWCHFAHYGKDNSRSVLVQFDAAWRELRRWTYPKDLVAEWGSYSLSGGLWQGDELLGTGHDKKAIYRLRVPREGKVIEMIEVIPAPFPGQGIATDPKTGGLVGIDRGRKEVIFAVQRQ
jgi:hypothetical protein